MSSAIWFIQSEFLQAVCFFTRYPLFHMALLKNGSNHCHETLTCAHTDCLLSILGKKQFFSLSYFLNIKFSDFISLECSFTTTQKQHNKNQLIAKWLRKLLRHCFDWGFLCLILIIRLWRTHLTCLDGNYNISLTFDHHNCPETHLNYTDIWCGKCGGTQLSWGKPYLRMLSW